MTRVQTTEDTEEFQRKIEYCLDHRQQITKWEHSFLCTCCEMNEKNIMLSEKQVTIMERVYKQLTRLNNG